MTTAWRTMKSGGAVKAHPDRLVGAASLYPFILESEFREEVKRCRESHGFRALKVQPQYQALNPISPASDFLFETALENDLRLICHTGSGVPFALPSLFMLPARRHRGLTIILAHCGGGGLLVSEAIVAASFCPNIYLELSTLMPHHVLDVLSHVPSDRLMVGSDLPESLDTELGKVLGLDIPAEQKRSILFGTAAAVFDGRGA